MIARADTTNAIAATQLDLGHTEAALGNLREAVQAFQVIGHVHGVAGATLNIGSAYQDYCDLDGAMDSYEKSVRLAIAAKSVPIAALALASHANALLERGDAAGAADRASQALALCKRQDVEAPEAEGWAHVYRSAALIEQQQLDKAEDDLAGAREKLAGISAKGMIAVAIQEAKIAFAGSGSMSPRSSFAALISPRSSAATRSIVRRCRPSPPSCSPLPDSTRMPPAKLREAHAAARQLGVRNCESQRIDERLRQYNSSS